MGAGGAPVGASTVRVAFRALGPIEVTDDANGAVVVGGPKERLVLAHLLARANTTVSLDALVETLWADAPPRSAERTMRSYIARLRRALAPDRPRSADHPVLATEGRGYRLIVGPDRFDAMRFETLARRGGEQLRQGDAAAAHTLREALRLWTGAAYAEFADVDAIAPEARRLDELRLAVLEDRVEADLTNGSTTELAAEIEGLVAEHPFRERLWGQLMLALYQSGRQRDALAAYQRARTVLVEELGIEPGPELRRLEAAILAQDPALDGSRAEPEARPGGLPAALESVGPAFVGRDAEMDWLGAAWKDAAEGRGRFVSLLGPEGIGKTRLVAELAHRVDADDGVVLYGRCDHAHRGARVLLEQALRSAGTSLARLDDGGPVADPAAAVARFLPTWSRGRPVLVVLDDLHLADAETLEVVADLAGWCAAEPMLVVGAFRTDAGPPDTRPPEPGEAAAQLVLDGLTRSAVGRICALYAEDDWLSTDVARLHEFTGGVPLLVHEQASEWARARAVRRAEDAADRLTGARTRVATSRAEIADSVEGIGRLLEQRRAQLSGRQATLAPAGIEHCPYKGLARFEAADASDFFGRERMVAELVARLPGASLVTVLGPSGSGKSSLVRAGVLPALASGVLPGTDRWRTVTMCPGPHPARELSRALRPAPSAEAADRLVLFVDQFEEAFTQCLDLSERDEFMRRLDELLDRPGTVVVIAVRADHLGRFAPYPALAERLTSNDVLVGPMREHELRRVIELPAQRAGLELEPGLVEVIVGDVAGRVGALPLLSTALAETWERRHQRTLTLAGYRAAGGVNGALSRMAEDAYQALPAGSQAGARRVLMRLCDAGDDGALDLRRRLPIGEAAPATDADARAALDTLVDRRLLTVDRDTVEVAHEALLREWPRLRSWLEDDVQGRRLHRRLGDAARSWEANDHDASELYRGARLDGATEWAAAHDADLNEAERTFLDASRTEAERDAADTRGRIADKAKTNRRLVGLLAGVGVLLVVALVAGVLAMRQGERAEREARDTRVRELAGESTLALDVDPELSTLLALEAVDVSQRSGEPPLPEAVAALHEAVQASRLELRSTADGAFSLDVSADGDRLATGSFDPPEAIIWDAGTGERLHSLTGISIEDLAFSPDGTSLALATWPRDEEAPALVIVDTQSGSEVSRFTGPPGRYATPAFSPDGRSVATVSTPDDGVSRVTVWDVASASERFHFEPGEGLTSVDFEPGGGTLIVTLGGEERIGFHAAEDGREIGTLATPGFSPETAELDRSGTQLAVGSQTSGAVQVWDLETSQLVRSIPVGDVTTVDWSPDGDRVAIGSLNRAPVRLVDVASGEDVIVLRGHVGGASEVVFIGDGERLASVGGDLRVWDVTVGGPPAVGAITAPAGVPNGFRFSPDGSEVAAITPGRAVEFLATDTGEPVRPAFTDLFEGPVIPIISPDWRLLASIASDGHGEIRDLTSLTPVRELPDCATPRGFSGDGSLLVLDGRVLCTTYLGDQRPIDPPAGADLRSRVIDVATGEVVIDLSVVDAPESGGRTVNEAAFNPEGRFAADRFLAVVVYEDDRELVDIYDVEARQLLTRLDLPDQLGLEFDPSGRWLTGRVVNGRVWVLDLAAVVDGASGDKALVFDRTTSDGVSRVDIDDSGLLATSGNGDGLVRLWDFASGELRGEFRTDRIEGRAVGNGWLQISPDASYILYTDAAGVIRRYLMDTDELIELAEGRLTRGFTADECIDYFGTADCP